MDINDTLLQAMNIMIQSALKKANFDKTIKAKIISNNLNQYRCNYQGATITAKSLNNNEYKIGDMVYILIPASNDGIEKIILGKV